MTRAKASSKLGTKAWRGTPVEEAQEETQAEEEVEGDPHPLKDHPCSHSKSHNCKGMFEWWEYSWKPSLVTTIRLETS